MFTKMFMTRIIILFFLSRVVSSVILIIAGIDVLQAIVQHDEIMYLVFAFLTVVYGIYYFRKLDLSNKEQSPLKTAEE